MAVQLESAARLAALRDKADAVTGESSATLAGAVDALIAGFGAGGSGDLLPEVIQKTITEISNDAVKTVGVYAFHSCTSLKKVSFPNVTSVKQFAFGNCTALVDVYIPAVLSIEPESFNACSSLEVLDLHNLQNIPALSLKVCSKLQTLVLRKESVCSLANVSAFNYTPFASGGTGGTVYVPSALITQYQQATNWSTLYAGGTCSFAAIEGSEYE